MQFNTKLYIGLAVIVVLVLQARLWFGSTGIVSLIKRNQAIVQQQDANSAAQNELVKLQVDVEILRKYPEALEGIARRNLGRIKKDETWYWVVKE